MCDTDLKHFHFLVFNYTNTTELIKRKLLHVQ